MGNTIITPTLSSRRSVKVSGSVGESINEFSFKLLEAFVSRKVGAHAFHDHGHLDKSELEEWPGIDQVPQCTSMVGGLLDRHRKDVGKAKGLGRQL